jgi:hypothetical protein
MAYDDLTKNELQKELKDRDLATSGSKEELVARLEANDLGDEQPDVNDNDIQGTLGSPSDAVGSEGQERTEVEPGGTPAQHDPELAEDEEGDEEPSDLQKAAEEARGRPQGDGPQTLQDLDETDEEDPQVRGRFYTDEEGNQRGDRLAPPGSKAAIGSGHLPAQMREENQDPSNRYITNETGFVLRDDREE